MPKINEMLLKLEYFKYAKSLDLNIGKHHVQLHQIEVIYVQLFSYG